MGWKPVPEAANMSKQRIYFDPVKIKEAGFMYVYLSYEGEGTNWVYFDDLNITHTKTNVIQYNEYYPYGLQTNMSWTRENSKNDFLYNAASELNQTSGWYEMFYRNYDPVIARFTGVDPLATKYASLSGYHYAYDNPVRFNDPSGAAGIQPGPPEDLWKQMAFAQAMQAGLYSGNNFFQDQGWFNNVYISSNSPIITVIKTNDPFDVVFLDGAEQGMAPRNSTQGNPNAVYYDSYEEYMKQYSLNYGGGYSSVAQLGNPDKSNFAEEIWNSDAMRWIVPDVLTLDVNYSTALGIGASETYTLNLITRGEDAGFHKTSTMQWTYCGLWGAGINGGSMHYDGPVSTLSVNSLLGPTRTISGEFIGGVNINAGYSDWSASPMKPSLTGISGGLGITVGAGYSVGETRVGWQAFNFDPRIVK
jgi:RHS repeat-associated protein